VSRSARAVAGAAVVSVTSRLRDRRRAERAHTVRTVLLLVAAAAVVAGTGWVALNSSLVAVREVTVEGTSRLSVGEVLAAADVPGGRSLFRVDPGEIAPRVERLPAVGSVTVTRDWPHRVRIEVVERQPVAVVEEPDGATLLDATGVAFARVASPPPGLVPVTLGGPAGAAGADDARAAMAVLRALPAQVRRQVDQLRAPSPVSVSLDLEGGRRVVWGSAEDGDRKATILLALLRRPAQVYDVSTPDVVVTR
jgi:cell division protein FtsQ